MLSILYLVSAVLFLWLLVLSFFLANAMIHYRNLTKDIEKKDLKSLLEEILKKMKQAELDYKENKKNLSQLQKKSIKHIQKVNFLRYNPFKDTGGDQSFILSLLNEENTGVVLSSFHGRDNTRVYAKKVKKGKGMGFSLSEEEEKLIKQSKATK